MSNNTFITARYDSARNICATWQDSSGEWFDVWFMAGYPTPDEIVKMADEDEEASQS